MSKEKLVKELSQISRGDLLIKRRAYTNIKNDCYILLIIEIRNSDNIVTLDLTRLDRNIIAYGFSWLTSASLIAHLKFAETDE